MDGSPASIGRDEVACSRREKPLLIEPRALADAASRWPWYRGLAAVVLVFLATRLMVWTAAYCGAVLHVRIDQGLPPPFAFSGRVELKQALEDPQSPLRQCLARYVDGFAPLLNWDAPHYWSVIEQGYQYRRVPPGTPLHEAQFNIAFFPLYPLVCRVFAPPLSVPGAMIAVANLAALAAALVFHRWCLHWADERTALAAVVCLCGWPTAGFLSFGYPEGLTLLLAGAMLLLADRGRFGWAALACGLATASRPTAVVLVPILMLAHVLRSTGPLPRRWLRAGLLGAVGALGIALYFGFLTWKFGSPQVYADNLRAGWIPPPKDGQWRSFLLLAPLWDSFKYLGRAFAAPPMSLIELANPIAWNMPVTLVLLWASLAGMRRVPVAFRPWLLVAPLIFVQRYLVAGWSSFGMESMARYVGVAAPAYLVLAAWCMKEWRPAGRAAILVVILLVQASWAFHFGLGEWAG